jgi:hypothetical protein
MATAAVGNFIYYAGGLSFLPSSLVVVSVSSLAIAFFLFCCSSVHHTGVDSSTSVTDAVDVFDITTKVPSPFQPL